jgi:hypothetical protein
MANTMGSMKDAYAKVARGVALYDVVSTLGMALPGLSVLTLRFYAFLHESLGLAGEFPAFAPAHQLFVNIVGILAFLWAVARIRLLDRFLVACDAYGRLVVASVILYYTFALGVSQVFLIFVATELIGAGLEFWVLKRSS